LQKTGDAGAIAAPILLEDSWARTSPPIEAALGQSSPNRRSASLSELTRPVAAVLESVSLIGAQEVRDEAVRCLCPDDDDLVGLAIDVLRATRNRHGGLSASTGSPSAARRRSKPAWHCHPERRATGPSSYRPDADAPHAGKFEHSSPTGPARAKNGRSPRTARVTFRAVSTRPKSP
jgi:hypothetical protein